MWRRVSISLRPGRRLSESNQPGVRLDHVRQCRFALRQFPPGRHRYQCIQLGPLRADRAAHDRRIRLANAVFFYLAQIAVQYDPAFLPLGSVSAPIIFTVFPAVVAALLYAGLLQFVRKHAAMVFMVISAITFVVTLIPDFAYIPTVDGVSNAEIAVLVVMHAIAATVITRGLTSVRR
jgi:hypothetical protein